jgi:hypothetical protein
VFRPDPLGQRFRSGRRETKAPPHPDAFLPCRLSYASIPSLSRENCVFSARAVFVKMGNVRLGMIDFKSTERRNQTPSLNRGAISAAEVGAWKTSSSIPI